MEASVARTELDPVRAANARIARAYDQVHYDPGADPELDADKLFGLAALHGVSSTPRDVLDLGCGAGQLLRRIGGQLTGRLVGVDLSAAACERARTNLKPLGDRVEVICADLLDLDEASLGQFDLILNIGVIYLTPPEVQRRLLTLIGGALKPGGVAVIGYYAGAIPLLRASLHSTLRAAMTPNATPAQHVATARANLATIESTLEGETAPFVRSAIQSTLGLPDTLLFHEALNESFDILRTTGLEMALAPSGVGFLGYLSRGAAPAATSVGRAIAADRHDLSAGGYRYGVFVKANAGAPDVRSAAIRWSCNLSRTTGSPAVGQATYFNARTNLSVTLRGALLCAFVEVTSSAPHTWDQALAAARLVAGAKAEAEATLAQGLLELWRLNIATPTVQLPA